MQNQCHGAIGQILEMLIPKKMVAPLPIGTSFFCDCHIQNFVAAPGTNSFESILWIFLVPSGYLT
jgi:hypothetical protein